MALQFVDPSQGGGGLNVLLYGPAKVGKSVGASSMPGPVLYLNGERPNALRYAHSLRGDQLREVAVTGLDVLHEAQAIVESKGSGGFKSIALDPLTDVHRVLLEEASRRSMNPKLDEYRTVGIHLERFCRALCDAPVNAVFVTHEIEVKDDAEGTLERLPAMGTNNPRPAAKLMQMVDVIGWCNRHEPEDGPVVYAAQLADARGRRGGDRTNLLTARGVNVVMDLSQWVETAQPWLKAMQAKKAEKVAA